MDLFVNQIYIYVNCFKPRMSGLKIKKKNKILGYYQTHQNKEAAPNSYIAAAVSGVILSLFFL